MKPTQPSLVFVTSVVVALVSLFFSTLSPLPLALIPIYLSTLLIRARMPRDSPLAWGGRLVIYAGAAIIGRAPIHQAYYYGVGAFITMGLILGGELILQSFREPPKGYKFDPLQLIVSCLLFLVGAGTFAPQAFLSAHLWIAAPLWMFLTLLSLSDVREDAPPLNALARLKQGALLLIAVCGGYLAHSGLQNNRAALASIGSKLLSQARPNVAEVGIADAPQMGSSFNTSASTSRLLRISGSLSDSHLRVGAFDEYVNGTWGPALSKRTVGSALPKETREEKGALLTQAQIDRDPIKAKETRTDWDAKITVLRPTNFNVVAPLNASALIPIATEGSESFNWNRFSGPLQVDSEPPLTYGIVNSRTDLRGIETEQGPLCVSLDPNSLQLAPDARKSPLFQTQLRLLLKDRQELAGQREKLLDVPDSIEPGVVELARRVTRGANTPVQKIEKINSYLLKNYKYSLEFVRGTQDPVSDFLLNKKSAHCQYFAAATVMMLRSVGVPARYASGFWAHEAAGDGTTIVRGRDAHAWCEAYVEKIGWINVESTPPSGRADPRANPLSWWQIQMERLEDTWARIRFWFGNLSALQITGIMLVVLAIWGAERFRQARKRARNLPQRPLPPLELQPLARGFEATLRKRGITLLDGQTWSEVVPPSWNEGRDFIEGYNLARFHERDEERLRDLTGKLRAIERAKRN